MPNHIQCYIFEKERKNERKTERKQRKKENINALEIEIESIKKMLYFVNYYGYTYKFTVI